MTGATSLEDIVLQKIVCVVCHKTPHHGGVFESPCCAQIYCWDCVSGRVNTCSICNQMILPENMISNLNIAEILDKARSSTSQRTPPQPKTRDCDYAVYGCTAKLTDDTYEKHMEDNVKQHLGMISTSLGMNRPNRTQQNPVEIFTTTCKNLFDWMASLVNYNNTQPNGHLVKAAAVVKSQFESLSRESPAMRLWKIVAFLLLLWIAMGPVLFILKFVTFLFLSYLSYNYLDTNTGLLRNPNTKGYTKTAFGMYVIYLLGLIM